MPPTGQLPATLSLLAAMALTGANVAFAKAIAVAVPVYMFVLFQFALASAALALIVRGEKGPRLAQMTGAQRRDLLLMALVGLVAFTAFMFAGLKRTAVADAGIITATLPAVVAALAMACSGDRPSRLQLASIATAVAGLLLMETAAAVGGTSRLDGNMLVGGAVLGEALFVILGKRLAPPYRPLRLALGANLAGLLLAAPLAVTDLRGFHPLSVTPALWLLGTWYALAASVVSRLGLPASPPPRSLSRRWRHPPCFWARPSGRRGCSAQHW